MAYISGRACGWDGCRERAMLHIHYGNESINGVAPLSVFVRDQKHADLCSRHIEKVNVEYGNVSGNEIGRCTFEFLPSRITRRRPERVSQVF